MRNKKFKIYLISIIAIVVCLGIANILSSHDLNLPISSFTQENNYLMEPKGTLYLDSEIYNGTEAVAFIAVDEELYNFDPGSIDYAYIFVNSSSDPIGILVILPETGVNTSLFSGNFTFSTIESNNTLDVILVQDGDTIVAHDNVSLFDSATWYDDGGVSVNLDSSDYYGVAAVAVITVIDDSYNINSTLVDSVNVNVNSSSDIIGITVMLTESGVNTSTFLGTFTFSVVASNDPADIIKALDGDTIMVNHDNIIDDAIWHATTTGIIILDSVEYRGTGAIAEATVMDSDLDITGSPDVAIINVNSTSDPSGISVQLIETGSATGIFQGSFTFSQVMSDDPSDVILTSDGDVVLARYDDEHTITGAPASPVDTSLWLETHTGIIELDSEVYTEEGTVAHITLTDADLDVTGGIDQVGVIVNSTSNGNGIVVQLLETGSSTGVFYGNFTFNLTASNDPLDHILVQDGDTVMTIYNDTENAAGQFVMVADSAIWTENDTIKPSIVLDSPQNETIINKPASLNLTITDDHLDPATVGWRANVTQTTWSSSFIGTYDIDVSGFASDQPVQFWIRANDTLDNQNIVTIILTFDDTPPTKPTNVSVSGVKGNLTIAWTASLDTNAVYYEIWRNGELIGNTTLTFYVDLETELPRKNIYEIVPVDEAGNRGESLIVKVKFKGPFVFFPFPEHIDIKTIIMMLLGMVGAVAVSAGVIVYKRQKRIQEGTSIKAKEQKLEKGKGKAQPVQSRPLQLEKASEDEILELLSKRLKNENFVEDFKQEIAILSKEEINSILELNIPNENEKIAILEDLAGLPAEERDGYIKALKESLKDIKENL